MKKFVGKLILGILGSFIGGLGLYWFIGEWESTKEFIFSIPSAIGSLVTYGIPLWIALILVIVIIMLINGYIVEAKYAGELQNKLKTDQDDPLAPLLDFTSTTIDGILVSWTYERNAQNKLIIGDLIFYCPEHKVPFIYVDYCSICGKFHPIATRLFQDQATVIQKIQHAGLEWIKAKESQAD